MKYITRNNITSYSVQLDGPQEEQQMFATLVENFYGIVPVDAYAGQIIEFPNKAKFIKFLKWREIWKQCAPNKQFKFVRFARVAISRVKDLAANNIIEVCI
jgi:hypothetical protein